MYKIGYNNSSKHYGSIFHYEKPDRLEYCIGGLKKLINKNNFIDLSELDLIKAFNLIKQTHSEKYLERIMNFESNTFICRVCGIKNRTDVKLPFSKFISSIQNCIGCLEKLNYDNLYCSVSIDTYFTPYTYQIALEGVGVIISLLDNMLANGIRASFALIRPPGHHCNNNPNGFCIFNNVFMGAKYAQNVGWNKVLILDIDFHHGDGTQELIESDHNPNISFISIHGYGDKIYPGTGKKSTENSNILNIPLDITIDVESRLYITDEYYQNILRTNVFPFVNQKNPDLIIVSLGFDAHRDDPLEGMNISDETYLFFSNELKKLLKPVLFVTEGGYNSKTIHRLIPKMIGVFDD